MLRMSTSQYVTRFWSLKRERGAFELDKKDLVRSPAERPMYIACESALMVVT